MILNNKSKKLRIINYFMMSFIFVIFVNVIFNTANMGPLVNLMQGNIAATVNFGALDFVKVFTVLIGETSLISVGFYQLTKKVF